MSENAIQETNTVSTLDVSTVETVLIGGDLSKLTPAQRVSYYQATCKSLGLNPLTRPFDYLVLNGKMVLYARRDATDQLRSIKGISITIASRETIGDVYVVTARATNADGRTDEATGVVSMKGLSGEALANGMMKAESKAKRRVTLSIVGLGMSDETEIETIPDAKKVNVDAETGEVIEPKPINTDIDVSEVMPDASTKELVSAMYETAKKNGKTTGVVREMFQSLFKVEKYTELSDEQLRKMILILGEA